MKTTTYKCDRCMAEDTDNKSVVLKFVTIGIMEQRYSSFGNGYDLIDAQQRGMDMCLACRKVLGIEPLPREEKKQEQTYPSLEEMIREIIREEITQ